MLDEEERLRREAARWRGAPRPHRIEPAGPGQESVWDYPRPPRLERDARRVRVEFAGHTVADTTQALRVLETASPPTFYLPPADVDASRLRPLQATSHCEWKGTARYASLAVGDRVSERAAWSYPEPFETYAALRGCWAFFAGRVDACWVGGERVVPQPGGFYGGWITPEIVGPFKGEPGSEGW